VETDLTLFEVSKPASMQKGGESGLTSEMQDNMSCDEGRFIRYNFTDAFLKIKTIGAT
jgi:hypothetical protein